MNRFIILDGYFLKWLEYRKDIIKDSTLYLYKCNYYNHISPFIGARMVIHISRKDILKMQAELKGTISNTTINLVIRILKVILNDAYNDGFIKNNPAKEVRPIRQSSNVLLSTHRALTVTEQKIFLTEAKGQYYYEFLAFLVTTGMRIGEAAALNWEDIDLSESVIHITKTMTYDYAGCRIVGDSPKSASGVRDIPINDSIRKVITLQKEKSRDTSAGQKVFTAKRGGYVLDSTVNRAIAQIIEKMKKKGYNISIFSAHALRDTFATRFIEQGGQAQTLKTILGHSSLAVTMDIYAHVLPNTRKSEMDKVQIII